MTACVVVLVVEPDRFSSLAETLDIRAQAIFADAYVVVAAVVVVGTWVLVDKRVVVAVASAGLHGLDD